MDSDLFKGIGKSNANTPLSKTLPISSSSSAFVANKPPVVQKKFKSY